MVSSVRLDGSLFGGEQQVVEEPGGGSTISVKAPPLAPGPHVIPITYAYPGEVGGSQALIVEVR